MFKLLALFIIIPVVELIIIIKIGSSLGFWSTFALIAVPGLLGATMARSQGIAVISRIKNEIAMGRLPGNQIIDGLLIFTGGLLLITPGILTDILGLTVLLPGARKVYRGLLVGGLWKLVSSRSLKFYIKR